MTTITRLLSAFGLAVALATQASGALAAEIRSFTVLRDGDPIGTHVFSFETSADGGRAVTVETDLEVKLAFITVFRFKHQRVERWAADDTLISLEGTTNDDGSDYTVELRQSDGGYRWTVNEKLTRLDAPVMTVSLWNPEVTDFGRLVSAVKDEVYAVSSENLGMETIEVPAGTFEAGHVRLTGELERDLWYDAGGNLLKVSFERRGSRINYVLEP